MSTRSLSALALAAVLSPLGMPLAAQAPARPSLVVFITVDQMRADYLDRFAPQFTGGLKRLKAEGAVFTRTMHDHAITETAPGHATTMSGRFPVHTGITYNAAGVNTPDAPLIAGAEGEGAAPTRFAGTTLTDWMRAKEPSMRFVSVSRKDRGAILPIGRTKGDVYWWAPGLFTTSTYYRDTLPTWVQQFNAERGWMQLAGKSWDLLLPPAAYAEPDSVPAEAQGGQYMFPYRAPRDSATLSKIFFGTPMMDSLTLAFGLRAVAVKELGNDVRRTDLLAISLNATDAVGHKYGPDSREIHDQILRLDRSLGAFFDSLFVLRDPRRITVVLTADHGMSPLPEVHSGRFPNRGASRVDASAVLTALDTALRARGVPPTAWHFEVGVWYVHDRAAFTRAGVAVDSVARALGTSMRTLANVSRSDLFTDFATADTVRDHVARRWLHMFAPGSEAVLATTLAPYSLWWTTPNAAHGMPYDDDAHVPLIFWGQGVRPGTYAQPVRTIDIAPTLARIVGVTPTERLDGRVLTPVLTGRR
jgi:arylsulfatase A-like enzyme